MYHLTETNLKLAKGTVAKAYALLEESEVLETLGRKGSFILNPTKNATAARTRDDLAEAGQAYVVAAKQLGRNLDEAKTELERQWKLF